MEARGVVRGTENRARVESRDSKAGVVMSVAYASSALD